MRILFTFMCVLGLGVMGCGETSGTGGSGGDGGTGGVDPSSYASKDLWLCRPDIENDRCDTADLSMTEIRPDGTHVTSEVLSNPNAEVDCFYVYHTVNYDPEPGNEEELVPHPEEVVSAVFRNGAHYRGTCRMFAPVYRQMSNITYAAYLWHVQESEFFQTALEDVVEAFEYYMRNHNEGRDFVLIGHSQGSHHLTELLRDKFDNDEALRAQLVSAVLMGPTGTVQVPEGELVGGSFTNIPLCASANETGCVIAFDSNYPEPGVFPGVGAEVVPPMARACVNPASFDNGLGTLAGLMYPRVYDTLIPFPDGVDTEWVLYPDIYTAQCSEDGFLEIQLSKDYTGDVPITPEQLQQALVDVWASRRYLHSAEYFFLNPDLVPIVERQIASRAN